MSVINQMLKDLEKRSRQSLKSELVLSGLHYSSQNRTNLFGYWKILISVAFIFLFIAFLTGKIILFQKQKNNLQRQAVGQTNSVNLLAPNKVDVPLHHHVVSTVLTGITLQKHENTTDLRLMLSQDTLYRIDHDEKNEKIILHFEHSHSISGLPNINYLDSAIKNMEMINLPNGELKISIALNPAAELKQLKLNDSGKYPELQLEFTHQEEALENTVPLTNQTVAIAHERSPIKKLVIDLAVNEEYKRAIDALESGDDELANDLLTHLLQKYPRYYLARETLVKLFLQRGDKKNAERLLEIGILQHPNYVPFIELRARMLMDAGKLREALDILQSNQPVLTAHPDYYSLTAALYQRLGEPLMAAKLYEQLLRVNSNKAVWWVGLGIALETLDKHNEASQAYAKARDSEGLTPELDAYIAGRVQTV